ncbi:MAG: bifunctional DNA-binding transcriptional regulator/O6-methylguanine-DNA methyltransferase Ada [Anaerolineae bacterium]|nr:bifunctional DNA-binding transcriptional regulator/O6-methylguanine-DNA methyltransferase Ada [Anaerolineae bacterium]
MSQNGNHNQPQLPLGETGCWQAVQARDSRYDGLFVYAVRSTGIYCRPSCPARRPRREHVTFFHTPEAAALAGFRACRRCHPDEVNAQVKMVRDACAYIKGCESKIPTLAELGAHLHVSPAHVQRVFKRIMGISPRQYADTCRLERFKTGLKNGQPVTDALYEAGYGSVSRVYQGQLGMTPTAYRSGGQDMHITYTIVDCSLGMLLVGATERGVCAVSLGDAPEALAAALHNEYPAATIERSASHDGLSGWVGAILRYLDGDPAPLDLPLDIQATAFQRRVWEALRAIPYGSTQAYGEIARAVGQPTASRAVARACATNPVALVIPCHRVVHADGGLSGYRWGVERKRALLAQEQANRAQSEQDQTGG